MARWRGHGDRLVSVLAADYFAMLGSAGGSPFCLESPLKLVPRRLAQLNWSYVVLTVAIGTAVYWLATSDGGGASSQRPVTSKLKLSQIPFNGERAYGYLKEMCAIGPRVSGSEGMRRQQAWLKEHFEKLGGRVSLQEFTAHHPLEGNGRADGQSHRRVASGSEGADPLCATTTRGPSPIEDRPMPQGLFVGANDGASGAAPAVRAGPRHAELENALRRRFRPVRRRRAGL